MRPRETNDAYPGISSVVLANARGRKFLRRGGESCRHYPAKQKIAERPGCELLRAGPMFMGNLIRSGPLARLSSSSSTRPDWCSLQVPAWVYRSRTIV